MAQTAPPSLETPPTAPTRASPSTFSTRADAWLSWMERFVGQLGAALANCYGNAVDAYNNAVAGAASAAAALASEISAAASAAASANSAGAALWVSGGNYAVGTVRRSPANGYPYVCYTAANGRTTDPSADTGYWRLAAASAPQLVVVSGTSQTAVAWGDYELANAGATTLTLPASPADGDCVWVTARNGRRDNVVARNGKTIHGKGEDMTLDIPCAMLRYSATYGDWRMR